MRLLPEFELINLADEHMLVPIGEKAATYKGVVVVSNASSFLLESMREQVSKEKLIEKLIDEYDIDRETAERDVNTFIEKLDELGVIER